MAKKSNNVGWWIAGIGGFFILSAIVNRTRVMSNLSKVQLGPNFTLDEFVVTSTGLDNIPDETAIKNLRALVTNVLQPARNAVQRKYPNSKIVWKISSGYRSPAVNTAIGGSDTSQHVLGQASDNSVFVDGKKLSNQELIDIIRADRLPYDQIIDENLKGKQWVHISYKTGGRKQWLTARDKTGGGTLYTTVQYG